MNKNSTWHIHIKGQVQGVGFRPFIYQLAQKFHLKGWVKNAADGLHIKFNSGDVVSKRFYNEVVLNAPQLSHITSHCIEETLTSAFKDFKIISSSNKGEPNLLISPDFAMCENCSREITDKTNRRYNYPFTTCTQCGPRYSIIKRLPYDREHTTMDVFKMCSQCAEEYHNPTNRRHFSQTNSCPDCAVVMKLYDKKKHIIEENQQQIINKVCALWNAGKIIAIKGIGGYLLTCDATNETAIKELRLRKYRPSKPFALMFPEVNSLQNIVHINEIEKDALQRVAAPIVLLQLKENPQSELALKEIAPQLSKIGVMLPYTPIYQFLLQRFCKSIIATSGNISNAPIVFEDEVALSELTTIADYVLVHNREIVASQDDCVVTYTRHSQQQIMLRRARGLAPLYINKNLKLPPTNILALGASMKSSFTLLHQQNIHTSQFLGDTDNYDVQKTYDKILHHFLNLFNAAPEVILIDKHSGYFTSQLGEQLAKKWNSQVVKVQHHEAHFASVLGEHNLLNEPELILGVIWDGTGFGEDGNIWGGEFFTYHQHAFSRVNHWDYYNHILGDKMATEPRLSAFSLCHNIEEASSILQSKFTTIEWSNYQKLIAPNKLKTSSFGRVFDAVASLLMIIDKTSYEGEAAMLLEEEALLYFKNELTIPDVWLKNDAMENPLSTKDLIQEILKKITEERGKSEIAAWFYVQLVLRIGMVASKHRCRKICFSGGVFQNGLLVDLVIKMSGEKYQLYFNQDLPPNDENISFGQLMWHIITNEKR